MRLLHVVDRLSDRGGAYGYLLGVLDALRAEHELLLAAGRDEAAVAAPCPVRVVPGLDTRLAGQDAKPWTDLERIARGFRPDVVHVHNVMNPDALRWAACRRDTLLTIQDHRYFCPTRGKWTRDGAVCGQPMSLSLCAGCFEDEAYFRQVHALTQERLEAARLLPVSVLSDYMKRELAEVGVREGRIAVIPPFVHGLEPHAQPNGPPCVLFVGRLVEAKGVFEAVEAWRRSGVDLPLVLAGTGPLRGRVGGAGIELLGWVPHARLAPVYRRARALLMPSRWQEPFGIAGLEALSLGVPVVAWDSGGVREWHPGDNLVPWGDVGALARVLREVVLGTAVGAHPPAGFDRETSMAKLLHLYETVAARD